MQCVRGSLSRAPCWARPCSTAGAIQAPVSERGIIERWMDRYEEFIGVKAVKEAQNEVIQLEDTLSKAQLLRRDKQAEIKNLQSRLKEIHFDLDRTSRGEDKYLHLLTEEHATIKKERALLEAFEQHENDEREAFYQLSKKVRESHEKERERAEKTKWWGVTASLVGATLGIIGSSIGNELRMRRLREMIPIGGTQMKELAQLIDEQNNKISTFILDIQKALNIDADVVKANKLRVNEDIDKVLSAIRSENERMSARMADLSNQIRLESSLADPDAVVYIGNDMERLLDQTEKNLESKMKLQTLLSVVFLYAAIGVTIPVVYAFFKGG